MEDGLKDTVLAPNLFLITTGREELIPKELQNQYRNETAIKSFTYALHICLHTTSLRNALFQYALTPRVGYRMIGAG